MNTNFHDENIITLTREEIFDLAMKKVHANVFYVPTRLERKTIHVPDYKNMLTGYILTNDKELPEYQEKIKILNEIMHLHSTNEYEQFFLFYLIFYIFLFPELQVVQNITSALKEIDKNQITYYQIQFKEIVEKLKLTKNNEIEKIVKKFPRTILEDNSSKKQSITGGIRLKKMLIIIIITLLYSISGSGSSLHKFLVNKSMLQTILQKPVKINKNELKHVYSTIISSVKDVSDLFKQQEFFYKLNKNKKAHEKTFTNNKKKSIKDKDIDVGKIINFISNGLDTVKLTNALKSNDVFSFIVDSKKVGKNLYEILNKQYDFTLHNTIVLLGNMSKLALYAARCLNQNIVLILEGTNALGSLSNAISSTLLVYEIHNDAIKTLDTFTKEQQDEFLEQSSFFGGKKKTKKTRKQKK